MKSDRIGLNIWGFFLVCDCFVFADKMNGTQGCWLTRWCVATTSSCLLVWSGVHEMGHITSQTSVIITSNKGVCSCEAFTKLHWKMHRMCSQHLSYKIKRSSD